jgi:hypothetical protein
LPVSLARRCCSVVFILIPVAVPDDPADHGWVEGGTKPAKFLPRSRPGQNSRAEKTAVRHRNTTKL